MSPNIRESSPTARKRDLDEFAEDYVKPETTSPAKAPASASIKPSQECLLPPAAQHVAQSSPQGSPALTEAGSSTPNRKSPSPQTPTKLTPSSDATQVPQPLQPSSTSQTTDSATTAKSAMKPRRLTPAEKQARDKEAAEKKKEKEEKAKVKAAEKARQEEEKASRMKEREEKRQKKEEDERIKNQQRDEKKRKKEEELLRAQEEKDKKARAQPAISNFFRAPATPKRLGGDAPIQQQSPAAGDNTLEPKPAQSEYKRLFRPFFVRQDVRVASISPQMDAETQAAKSSILDEYISGQRQHTPTTKCFDAMELFNLPYPPVKRGHLHHPVKQIMEKVYEETEQGGQAGPDEASRILKAARQKLSKVPVKVIAFSRDVRPAYYGTVTFKPFDLGLDNMRQLARMSSSRRLPLDYDYDSEAEWQEEEEGEDIDMDDEEEELEDEDDMDGFLDDAEDFGPSRRIFANTMEPDCTGICFQDQSHQGIDPRVYNHRMEFIQEGFANQSGIDPFSCEYWEPEVKTKVSKAIPPAGEKSAKMPPPPAPANAFAALNAGVNTAAAPVKMMKDELLNDVKQIILDNKALSKVGMIEIVFHKFREAASVSRAEVKNTIEHVAEKKGAGRTKEWGLRDGHDIVV